MADDLQTLGDKLRAAREARALSLSEVEAHTKIREKFLQALEEGDLSVLPSHAHARGFLRNYAQFLALDANALVAEFNMLTGVASSSVTTLTAQHFEPREAEATPPLYEQPTDESQAPPAWQPPPPSRVTYVPPERRSGPAMPRGVAARQAAPPASTWQGTYEAVEEPVETAADRAGRRAGNRGLRANLITGAVLLTGLIAVSVWSILQVTGREFDASLATPRPISEVIGANGPTLQISPTATFRPTSTPEADVGPRFLDRVVLTINVVQRTWTMITVDGVVQFEGQTTPNTVLQYEGAESIIVKTGNGAGLRVTYNGQDIGLLGERGEVVERFFTTGGMLTPTATPSPTPTNTPVPTPTSSPTPGR